MNETPTTIAKKVPVKRLLVGAVMLIAIGGGLMVARGGLDAEMAKKKLDEVIAGIKEKSQQEGRDINLTYEKIEMTGGLMDRHAKVYNPVMVVRPYDPKIVTPDPKDSLRVTTEELDVYGASYDLSAIKISLPKPLDFASGDAPDKSLLKVEASSPLEATIAQKKINNIPYVDVAHTAPTSLDLTYLREKQAQGTEDATPSVVPVYDTIHIAIASGGTIKTSLAEDDSGLGRADISFGQITTVPKSAPEGVITVAGIEGHWLNEMDAHQKPNLVHQWKIGPITAAANALPYAPIALNIDFSHTGVSEDTDNDDSSHGGKVESKPSTKLKVFELSTKDATLSANADFITNANDILPTGNAHLKLTNVPFVMAELKKRGILQPEKESWVADLLQRITGTPFDQLKDADIAIDRPQGGQFKIGNSTFEEVFALFMKNALNIDAPKNGDEGSDEEESSPPAPQLPDASKEKAKPIAVPDNGVRG